MLIEDSVFSLLCRWYSVISMKPDDRNQITKLQVYLKDIKAWMSHNFLLLISDEIEVFVLSSKNLRTMMCTQILTMDIITLVGSNTVRNLWVVFDQDVSFSVHIKQIAFCRPCNMCKIRNSLPQSPCLYRVTTGLL